MITLNEIEDALDRGGFHAMARGHLGDSLFICKVLAELRKEYVLVPREPTKELCDAIGGAIDGDLPLVDMRLTIHGLAGYHAYRAMIAASQTKEKQDDK